MKRLLVAVLLVSCGEAGQDNPVVPPGGPLAAQGSAPEQMRGFPELTENDYAYLTVLTTEERTFTRPCNQAITADQLPHPECRLTGATIVESGQCEFRMTCPVSAPSPGTGIYPEPTPPDTTPVPGPPPSGPTGNHDTCESWTLAIGANSQDQAVCQCLQVIDDGNTTIPGPVLGDPASDSGNPCAGWSTGDCGPCQQKPDGADYPQAPGHGPCHSWEGGSEASAWGAVQLECYKRFGSDFVRVVSAPFVNDGGVCRYELESCSVSSTHLLVSPRFRFEKRPRTCSGYNDAVDDWRRNIPYPASEALGPANSERSAQATCDQQRGFFAVTRTVANNQVHASPYGVFERAKCNSDEYECFRLTCPPVNPASCTYSPAQ